MAITANPTSLKELVSEFGNPVLAGYVFTPYNTPSGTVTAPANATRVVIKAWGGGGGSGAENYPGYGAGFIIKILPVVGGVTTVSYDVGSGGEPYYGSGGAGGNSSFTVNGITYIAYGGTNSAVGTTSGNGDFGSEDGHLPNLGAGGSGNLGGPAGGYLYFGGAGPFYTDLRDPGGGAHASYGYGGNGQVEIYFITTAFSAFTRGSGIIPNHEHNSSIPTTSSGLALSAFNGTGLNFKALVDTTGSTYTHSFGGGSISYKYYGYNRNSLVQTEVLSINETRGIYYDLLGSPAGYIYNIILTLAGDMRPTTLGYYPTTGITVNGVAENFDSLGVVSYNGSSTSFTGLGRYTNFGDYWAFVDGSGNEVEIYYNSNYFYDYNRTDIYTNLNNATQYAPAVGDGLFKAKIWGDGGGGFNGYGGGGGGYAEVFSGYASSEDYTVFVGQGGTGGTAGTTWAEYQNTGTPSASDGGGSSFYMDDIFNFFSFRNKSVSGGRGGKSDAGGEGGGVIGLLGGITINGGYGVLGSGGSAAGNGGAGGSGSNPGQSPGGGGGGSNGNGARGEVQIEWYTRVPLAYGTN